MGTGKILLAAVVCGAVLLLLLSSPEEQTVRLILEHRDSLLAVVSDNPVTAVVLFLLLYIILVSVSFPGAAALTIAAGMLFGLPGGMAVAICGSVTGATLATLATHHLFRATFKKRFGGRVARIQSLVEKNYTVSLLLLRLCPVFPFFLVNIALGLTRIHHARYIIFSALGMLPGTALFVYIGTHISAVEDIGDIVTPEILLALTALALMPAAGRYLVLKMRNPRR